MPFLGPPGARRMKRVCFVEYYILNFQRSMESNMDKPNKDKVTLTKEEIVKKEDKDKNKISQNKQLEILNIKKGITCPLISGGVNYII
jgi:hypothetical protein